MLKRFLASYLLLFVSIFSFAQKPVAISSPNGAVVFNLQFVRHSPQYTVSFNGTTIISKSIIALNFTNGLFKNDLASGHVVFRDFTEIYDLLVGKASHVEARFRAVTIPLVEQTGAKRIVNLEVKLFDDGLAFRYVIPAQKGWAKLELMDELTNFNITGNPVVKALQLPDYTSSHEGLYTTAPWQNLQEDTLMDMPALFQFPRNIFMAITEANLLDYAGMYLMKHNGALVSKLSPLPNAGGIKVKAILPHHSPWRVMLLGNRAGALLESNMLTSLCEAPEMQNWKWLKPGKTTFPWWNGNVVPDTLNAPGNNFVTNQYYIDFCARNNIEYHTVVEYGLHQWYTDDGAGFQPGPHADVTTPVPGLDMKEICDYAAKKGVGIRVWVHFYALYPKLDSAFAIFERWGLSGMMVDFMDRDDQEMVNMQTEILQKAAQHHLHVQFHGAYKPTGLERTYPNELTREGTRNYETNKWGPAGLSPDHDLNIALIRGLAGSTDYHLGGFRAVHNLDFKAQYTRPLMLGTRCHMLAMYIVLQNALPMVADYPSAYEGQAGFEFIKAVPATWDEIKVITAVPDEYLVVARRKGTTWYVGAITNHAARTINIVFNFLPAGTFKATSFTDSIGDDPNRLKKEVKGLTPKDVMHIELAASGGAALIVEAR